jgi:transposase
MPASARKSRHAMKVFYFDGTGLCVFYKRLDAGTFRMPLSHDGTSPTIVLSERQLSDLFAGIEIEVPTKH